MFDLALAIRRAWPVFLEAIRMGRTITYTELAGRAGPPLTRRQVHRQLLSPLADRCRLAGLPDLSALVVRQDTGMPGAGWHGVNPAPDGDRVWAEALAECYAFNWPSKPPQTLLGPAASARRGKPV